LDLKLENLLIGADFRVKIADFDQSYKKGDMFLMGSGTSDYRSPELSNKADDFDPFAADIYSAGILLFFMALGRLPYREDEITEGIDL